MHPRSAHLPSIIENLYSLFKRERGGVEESVLVKYIYTTYPVHLKQDSIIRQVNRLVRRVEEEKKCTITRRKNGFYKIAKNARGSLQLNKQIDTLADIKKCLFKKDHAIKVLAIQGYISKKGRNDYDIIVMDAAIKNGENYFKGYRVVIKNSSIQLHPDAKLKRFYLSNCSVVIPYNFRNYTIDPELKKKLYDFEILEKDSFDFFIKKNTTCQTVTINFTDFFYKYLTKQKNVELTITRLPPAKVTDTMQYETQVRFNNIKNLITLISPHIDEIRFGTSVRDSIIKKEIKQFFTKNLKGW